MQGETLGQPSSRAGQGARGHQLHQLHPAAGLLKFGHDATSPCVLTRDALSPAFCCGVVDITLLLVLSVTLTVPRRVLLALRAVLPMG